MRERIRKHSRNPRERYKGKHRFEHWIVDNQIYFITARCRDRFPAFASEEAKRIFEDRFEYWCKECGIISLILSVLDNHYHAMLYVKKGADLKKFMQRLHGSVAKRVNDLLPERREDFWRDSKGEEYFDGCIRDEKQCRAAFRYTHMQARRHGVMYDFLKYKHTKVYVELNAVVKRALEIGAFMEGVPYKRYER
jgi:REP element-mobilizing transposase RayT